MILKQLREKRKISQEQLALMAGLSVRTIQRIERGHKASFESLRSLASALEVDIATLEQEIDMIDKSTDEWKKLPFFVKLAFVGPDYPWMGIYKKQAYVRGEKISAIVGVVFLLLAVFNTELLIAGTFFIFCAYLISLATRMGDHYSIW
ncbi:MAG: helix-turn-helix domain-containing protein [Cellvibrio sp.]|uniref:helix-turn-helix domain-containing protein n=1 Tax=Cellvibrio sp. TaxID=1965322 RepID=UPI0031B39A6E